MAYFYALEMEKEFISGGDLKEESSTSSQPELQALEVFGINYNKMAESGSLDDIVGKENEIQNITEILCRRKKNNPILIGEPGVGKSALIEGLAQQIVSQDVSDHLLGHTIYGLDLASMIAGTKYRGQFEQRLKKVVDEASQNPRVILFIDEIHTLVGAGSAEGTMDAANILKPALARGQLRCIGATTFKEYKKHIQKDGALDRRFQSVIVEEPTPSETLNILKGIKKKYEKFHQITYSPQSLKLAVELSHRYITDRYMPDKAIDLIDQAGSKVKIKNFKRPLRSREIEKEIESLMAKEEKCDDFIKKQSLLEEQEVLFEEYKDVLNEWSKESKNKKIRVTEEDILEAISTRTNIPLDKIQREKSSTSLSLERRLKSFVVGQDVAVKSISNAILRNKAGLRNPLRPIGSFLFLGPSGVGKTHTAQILAKEVFGSRGNLIQIDMSEFSEKHTSSKLIGAAPGYVGYDESGQLTEKIKKKPYSVVLFDEIEKAHEDISNLLLQVLDEGRLTDNFGIPCDFKNSIVILTSNVGFSVAQANASLGFKASDSSADSSNKILEKARSIFKPEILNRLDETLVFNSFENDDLRKIVNLELKELNKRLKKKKIKLKYDEGLVDFLAAEALSINEGARPIAKLVSDHLENPIAYHIMKHPSKLNLKAILVKNAVKVEFS